MTCFADEERQPVVPSDQCRLRGHRHARTCRPQSSSGQEGARHRGGGDKVDAGGAIPLDSDMTDMKALLDEMIESDAEPAHYARAAHIAVSGKPV